LKERPPEIAPALFARMRRVASLGELKGMGLKNALALEKLGIKGVEDLARQNPEELLLQLGALHQKVRLEEVKIWIRAAKRHHG
jgi:predicted RecB family nuclease